MLILNRDFKMPEDGWYQLAPLGEFAHANAGVIQVIDEEACLAMAARFAADAAVPSFAGLLVDFDHFSLNRESRSEAAGWIIALEARCEGSGFGVRGSGGEDGSAGTPRPTQSNNGLWAQIRWSDVGEAAVKGGRYRFLSPVWGRTDCVDLGMDPGSGVQRVRPVRLLNAAVTNDPNLRGIRPLSNSGRDHRPQTIDHGPGDIEEDGRGVENGVSDRGANGNRNGPSVAKAMEGKEGNNLKAVIEKLVNHLGLAADAAESVILEKMAGMPALTAVSELQNSLTAARTELDALKGTLKAVEGELVNRHLEEFEGVVTEKTKGFWTEQLMTNRQTALAALGDLATQRDAANPSASSGQAGTGQARKPLHNRATARPAQPGGGAATGEAESKAVMIRNRAQEIMSLEKVPFSVAFRRAEKEVAGNG